VGRAPGCPVIQPPADGIATVGSRLRFDRMLPGGDAARNL